MAVDSQNRWIAAESIRKRLQSMVSSPELLSPSAGMCFDTKPTKPCLCFSILCQMCHNIHHRLFISHLKKKLMPVQVAFKTNDVRNRKFKLQDDC